MIIKTTLKYLLLLVFFASLTVTCKKYEDGPLFSFRSAKSRLIGKWKVEEFLVDGVDSIQQYNDSMGGYIEFLRNNDPTTKYSGHNSLFWDMQGHIGGYAYADWELKDNNRILEIHIAGYGQTSQIKVGPLGFGLTHDWKIKRLTNRHIVLEAQFNNKTYQLSMDTYKE
jgi:hypothetical protein